MTPEKPTVQKTKIVNVKLNQVLFNLIEEERLSGLGKKSRAEHIRIILVNHYEGKLTDEVKTKLMKE